MYLLKKFNELKNFECLNFHGFSGFFISFDFLDKLRKIHVVIYQLVELLLQNLKFIIVLILSLPYDE